MMTDDTTGAIRTITEHAREITRGSYKNTEELQRLTDESIHPPEIAHLAEAFGMMAVKVEAREFALQKKNEELEKSLKLRTVASNLLIWFAIGISLYIFLLAFFYQPGFFDTAKPILIRWFGIAFIFTQVLLMTFLILKGGLPLSAYGVTLVNWKKSLKEGLLASGAVILGLFILKLWMINAPTIMKGAPLIAVEELSTLFFYTFMIIAPLQEFLIRGVLQSSTEMILMGKQKVFLSVFTVSLIFGALHTIYSLPFALITFAVSLFLGWLYSRHHNLIGVSVSHLFMGWAFILFGFWEIIAF